jgi:hypothetical protein
MIPSLKVYGCPSQSPSSPWGNLITTTQRSFPVHDEITLEDNFSQEKAPFPKREKAVAPSFQRSFHFLYKTWRFQSMLPSPRSCFYFSYRASIDFSSGIAIFVNFMLCLPVWQWFYFICFSYIYILLWKQSFFLVFPCMVAFAVRFYVFAVHRSFLFYLLISIIAWPEETYSLDCIRLISGW